MKNKNYKNTLLYFIIFSLSLISSVHYNNSSTNHYHIAIMAPYLGEFCTHKNTHSDRLYKTLDALNPTASAYISSIHFLFYQNRFNDIIKIYEKHKNAFEDNPEIQLIFTQALSACNRAEEGHDLLTKITKNFSSNQKIALYATQIYLRCQNTSKALKCIDNYLAKAPKTVHNYLFYFLKSQCYDKNKDPYQAIRWVKKSLKLYPSFDKGWILYASLQEKTGNISQAIYGYSQFLRHTPLPNQVIFHTSLLQLKSKKNIIEKLSSNSTLDAAQQLYNNGQLEAALITINNIIEKNNQKNLASKEINFEETMKLKVAILTALCNYKEASEVIYDCLKKDSLNEVWLESLHFLYRSGFSIKKTRTMLQKIASSNPNSLMAHLYLADILTRTEQFQLALFHHNKALDLTNKNDLKMRLYFNMATIHYHKKEFPLMLSSLEKIYTLNSSFLPAVNLHAYYCASKGKDISKAHELIKIALKKEPENSDYLDTLAFILYKENKNQEATTILTALSAKNPENIAITHHLAKLQNKQQLLTAPHHTILSQKNK